MAQLPERDRILLRRETGALFNEGRRLAERILIANFDGALIPLGNALAEHTYLDAPALRTFYEGHPLVDPADRTWVAKISDWVRARVRRWYYRARRSLNPELIETLPRPARVGDVSELAKERRRQLFAEVPPPADAPVLDCASRLVAVATN